MLTDPFSSPDRNIYVLGARIISVFRSRKYEPQDPDSLFKSLNFGHSSETRISWGYYQLALDWLFIRGVIRISKTGELEYVA